MIYPYAARGYNGGVHPTGTSAWFLPSAGQWDKMATAAGGYDNLRTNAGLATDGSWWSSSENAAGIVWAYNALGYAKRWETTGKDYSPIVYPCLAF